ncbi:MAG: hypothetical protein WA057_05240 [Candidatus Magasanikiibacteriota bacterium]
MRDLTTEQKKFIKELMTKDDSIISADDILSGEWDVLEEMNNTEVLYQNVNRFIIDLRIKQLSL